MAIRFPVSRERWTRRLPLHLLAVPAVAWVANLGVVSGFWWLSGTFAGLGTLARQAAFWATIRIHVAVLVYAVSYALTHGWLYVQAARARATLGEISSALEDVFGRYQATSRTMAGALPVTRLPAMRPVTTQSRLPSRK